MTAAANCPLGELGHARARVCEQNLLQHAPAPELTFEGLDSDLQGAARDEDTRQIVGLGRVEDGGESDDSLPADHGGLGGVSVPEDMKLGDDGRFREICEMNARIKLVKLRAGDEGDGF